MASKVPLLTLAKALVLIGGVVLIIGGLLQAIDARGLRTSARTLLDWAVLPE